MNRPALIISILLTALALTITGGVVYSVRATQNAQAAQAAQVTEAPVQIESQAAVDPGLEQALLDREASYQKMIAEANTRLAQAQKTQQALQDQINLLQNPPAPAAGPEQAFAGVSPEMAAQIAADFLKQSSIYSVETTAISGAVVYKVTFSSGDIVYVSLDGQVIGSQAAPQQVKPVTQLARHSGGYEGEHEHEDEDDD